MLMNQIFKTLSKTKLFRLETKYSESEKNSIKVFCIWAPPMRNKISFYGFTLRKMKYKLSIIFDFYHTFIFYSMNT